MANELGLHISFQFCTTADNNVHYQSIASCDCLSSYVQINFVSCPLTLIGLLRLVLNLFGPTDSYACREVTAIFAKAPFIAARNRIITTTVFTVMT